MDNNILFKKQGMNFWKKQENIYLMDWFLHDNSLFHEKVKGLIHSVIYHGTES